MKQITSRQSSGFIKSIKDAIPKHCSNCGHRYTESDLNLVQKDDFTALLHLSCSNCKEAYLINVVSPLGTLQGSSRMPLKIDVSSAEEARKFIGKKAVSSNDVLNVHEELKKIKTARQLLELLQS